MSDKMPFWKGADIETLSGNKIHVDCLKDVLNDFAEPPTRETGKAMRVPISGIYKIKGVGDVLTVEMHHKKIDEGKAGDNVGMNLKGLDKQNMPRTGDVMILKSDSTLGAAEDFNAQVQILDIPGELKVGYSPIGFVRTGHAACRVKEIVWKVGKETGGKKLEAPHSLKSNEMAEIVFAPCQPLVVDSFKNCEGLSRIAFLDGNSAVMLGKVTKCTQMVSK